MKTDMAKLPGLFQRGSVYQLRVVIPLDIRAAYGGKPKLVQSLNTPNLREAKLLATQERSRLLEEFEHKRLQLLPQRLGTVTPEMASELAQRVRATVLALDDVILGVDTHLDVHVGVVINQVGRVQGTYSIATNAPGYEELLGWAQKFGNLKRAGIEGTSSYGAGLTRFLQANGITVIEINRLNRTRRRGRGKSDLTDAENAARAVLAEDANSVPKAQSGLDEALRMLKVASRSAVKAKTQALNQLRALLVSAPQSIRDMVLKENPAQCLAACSGLDCGDKKNPVIVTLTTTLRLLTKRWNALHEELKELEQQLSRLTNIAAPDYLGALG